MAGPIDRPGPFELDIAACCGHTLAGGFLWTLSATDVLIGWMLLVTIRKKAFVHVAASMD